MMETSGLGEPNRGDPMTTCSIRSSKMYVETMHADGSDI